MKRAHIESLSRKALKKLATNKIAVVKATKEQFKKMAEHKNRIRDGEGDGKS